MQDSKIDTDVYNSLLDSVGEGEGRIIWENGIETCILSYKKWKKKRVELFYKVLEEEESWRKGFQLKIWNHRDLGKEWLVTRAWRRLTGPECRAQQSGGPVRLEPYNGGSLEHKDFIVKFWQVKNKEFYVGEYMIDLQLKRLICLPRREEIVREQAGSVT